MVSDCCGAVVRFQDMCSRCGEHCEVVGEDDSYLDVPDASDEFFDGSNRFLHSSDDGYDAAVDAYNMGYGPPVTRRQRLEYDEELREYRKNGRY